MERRSKPDPDSPGRVADERSRPGACPSNPSRPVTGTSGWTRRRGAPGRLLAAIVLLFAGAHLTGCASTPVEEAPVDEPPPPVTAGSLATSLGLRAPRRSPEGALYLEGSRDERIALFPGTRVTTVRGVRYTAQESLAERGDDVWISAVDANVLRRMWQQGLRAGPSRSAVGAFRGAPPRDASAGARLSIDDLPPLAGRGDGVDAAARGGSGFASVSAAERRAWGVPLRRPWQYIVVHHSATPGGSAASFHEAHRARGWDGLGYHFVIGNGNKSPDGRVEVGFRWTQQREGAHAGNDLMNQRGIGICLVGDFSKSAPTAAQMQSLRRLCDFLSAYCDIAQQNLRLHRDFRQTECPGRYFPRTFALRPSASVRGAADSGRRDVPAHR